MTLKLSSSKTKIFFMKKLKIGFVGANYVTKHLLNALAEKHDVVVWAKQKPDEPISLKINFIFLDRSWENTKQWLRKKGNERSLPQYFKKLLPSLKLENPDVLVVMEFINFYYWQVLLYSFINPQCKIILLSETKRKPTSRLSRLVFWIFLDLAKIFAGRITKVYTYDAAGEVFFKKHFPNTHVETFLFPVDENTPWYKKPTAGSTIRILMPARFVAFKRHEDVIEAMKLVPDSLDIQIDFANFDSDQSTYHTRIEELVADTKTDSRISISDTIQKPFSNYYNRLADYDCVLLPSDNEAVGAVIPAALHCGRATVTSDTVGANVFVKDTEVGYIVKTKDVESLSQTLQKLDKKILHQMGQTAAKRMRSDFSAKNQAQKFIQNISENLV